MRRNGVMRDWKGATVMRPSYSSSPSRRESDMSVSYEAIASSIPRARAVLRQFGLAHGASGDQLDDIALASSEALTNVVEHAYSAPGGEIHVSAGFDREQLSIVIADD